MHAGLPDLVDGALRRESSWTACCELPRTRLRATCSRTSRSRFCKIPAGRPPLSHARTAVRLVQELSTALCRGNGRLLRAGQTVVAKARVSPGCRSAYC